MPALTFDQGRTWVWICPWWRSCSADRLMPTEEAAQQAVQQHLDAEHAGAYPEYPWRS